MANIASARKAARQSEKRRALNASQRSELRSAIKRVRKAIEAGDKVAARAVLRESTKVLDTIADKKIIHKNKASRHKSRLSAAIKAMAYTPSPAAPAGNGAGATPSGRSFLRPARRVSSLSRAKPNRKLFAAGSIFSSSRSTTTQRTPADITGLR